MAVTLAEAGANVVLAARSLDKLAEVASLVNAMGVKALVQGCDVTDPEQVRATVQAAWDEFGRADILVNNAGVIAETGIMPERVPDSMFAQTMLTNVNGVFSFCREVGARQLADGGGGSIINIASVAGLGASAHFPTAYQTSKAAVINMTKNLAVSWASRGVRVNTLCPGWFTSEMTIPFFGMPSFKDRVEAMTPMGRIGRDSELDGALLFLASDASSFMTGATLVIDGGVSSHLGGVDYSPELFAALTEVAGDYGTRITPA
jgi:gluconate 5-dehydrogenase